jgi:hypothetical protein
MGADCVVFNVIVEKVGAHGGILRINVFINEIESEFLAVVASSGFSCKI